jgi:hypothetical protein
MVKAINSTCHLPRRFCSRLENLFSKNTNGGTVPGLSPSISRVEKSSFEQEKNGFKVLSCSSLLKFALAIASE